MCKTLGLLLLASFLMLIPKPIEAQTLTIAAAADLRYAMEEVVKSYKQQNPSIDIQVNYGSSGTAFQQISNGAPYDLFFSADILYPQKLEELGLTYSKPKLYAIGYIVLWSSKIDLSVGMKALLNGQITKIAIANPEHAPYGKRAEESLKFFNLYDQVKSKLIFGENISQAAQFVYSGNAEIGILALSLACSPTMKEKGKYMLIDDQSHSPLKQAYVILKRSTVKDKALSFAKFVASPKARLIFQSYGFKLPSE